VIVPFKLDGGTIILVNRGWVSDDYKEQSKRSQFTRSGPTKVFGMARLAEPANRFTPENKPNQDEWYAVNTGQMAAYSGFRENVSPYIFYSEKLNKYYQGWPVPHDPAYLPANNHLGYAIFWFLMIIPLIAIYYLRFWKQTAPPPATRKKS
jgi:surfeit locus 1 family protein